MIPGRNTRRGPAAFLRAGALLVLALAAASARAEPFPTGPGQGTLNVAGEPIEIYTYKPTGYEHGPLLLVLHGLGRNAAGYRDYARPLADRYGYLVVAPLFDRKRFPAWRYQSGGITRDVSDSHEGEVRLEPESRRMGATLDALIDAVRNIEGAPALPYSVIGHSAGGQALSRYAAFAPNQARRIVIANPSTYLWPTRDIRFPYGLDGLPATLADDRALRRYFAQPIVILLGTADVKHDRNLNVRPGAIQQGANRYERGHNFYSAAQQIAQEHGWDFRWRLIEVPGVGHSARRMLGADAAAAAFSD